VPKSIAIAESTVRGVHTGVPSYFRGCCYEAAQGGTNGYRMTSNGTNGRWKSKRSRSYSRRMKQTPGCGTGSRGITPK
jgi:hypothetical protein